MNGEYTSCLPLGWFSCGSPERGTVLTVGDGVLSQQQTIVSSRLLWHRCDVSTTYFGFFGNMRVLVVVGTLHCGL